MQTLRDFIRKYLLPALFKRGKMIYSKAAFYKECLGSSEGIVSSVIANKPGSYNTYLIPKKKGSRTIRAIKRNSKLYTVQRNLTDNLFNKVLLPKAAKGFVKGSSYRHYLHPHKGSKFFLRIDIKDFFGSIKEDLITEMLKDIILISNKDEKAEVIAVIIDICLLDGEVPQGAVTSPALSNIVFSRLDQRVTKYCQKYDVVYTRYADDLLFSGQGIDFKEKPWFLRKIKYILNSRGFKLNYDKTKMTRDEISLNGFVVGNQIRLSRKRLSDIINIIRHCDEKNIPGSKPEEESLNELNGLNLKFRIANNNEYFKSINSFMNYLCGCRAYMISWVDDSYSGNQKQIQKIINKTERLIIRLAKAYGN
jgi:hypothetical protein